ncbi:hypothetical protein [Gemmobacter sp. LW-1]|uniref:hypothetical protein n=1 Tax=Gemmobacter sp. LW-1 TaxID=1529005 RepID=UPI0013793444|nr:hypothetical protein [Gemmobacter sp. LW-1]
MKVASKDAIDDIQNIHQGIHLALDALVRSKDYRRSEELLRQIDQLTAHWLNTVKVAR